MSTTTSLALESRLATVITLPICIPLEEKIGLAVRRAHARIAGIVGAHLEPDGISPREYACLCIVAGLKRRCNQRTVAELLWVHENVVINLVAKLEQQRLLRRYRDLDDRRHWCLSVTPQGSEVLRSATQHVIEAHKQLHIGLSEEAWKEALRALWVLAGVTPEEVSQLLPKAS